MAGNGRVLKNLIMVFASEGVGGLLSFIIVLLAARLLGVEQFGVFSYILAITSVCQLVADFGLTNLIVREVAKDTSRAQYIMSNVLSLAWVLSIVILTLVALIALFSLDTARQQSAAIIMGVAVLATYHSVVYSSVCRAFEQMSYNAISFVVHKVILLALIYSFYHLSLFSSSLLAICMAYLVANLCQYVYFVVVVRTRFIRFGFGRDFAFAWQLLKDAVPIGASMVIRRLTLQVDTLLLGVLATASAVGLFSAAYKVVQVVDMIPFAICLPLFPAMSRMASNEPDKLPAFFSLTLTGFLIVSIPLCGYVFVSAGNLIELFYGPTYVSAIPALRILAFAIIGLFVNMLLSYVFMALGKQRFYLLAAMSCLAVNALVDVLLIPRMGATGAAWGTLLGELSYFLLCIVFLSRVQLAYAWLAQLTRPVLLCVVISWVAYLRPPQGITEQVLFSLAYGLSYLTGLFVLRVFKPADIKRALALLTERQRRTELADNSASGSQTMRTLNLLQTGLHTATRPWRFIEQHPVLLLAALLMLVGSGGTWVVMPLTGEYRLTDLQAAGQNGQFKLVVLGLTALIFLTTAMRMFTLRLLVCFGLTALMFCIALSVSMFDGERIQLYITESQEFRDIQHILALNAIPNAGRSVETALAFDAYHFSDRIRASLGILGWGAKLSLLIGCAVSLYCIVSSQRKVIALLLALIFALATFFASGLGNVSLAYLKVNQGVRAINNGEPAVAIGTLNEAVALDPVLTYSPGFTLLHSYLYFSIYGPATPLAKAYQLEQRFSAGRFTEVIDTNALSASAAVLNAGEQQLDIRPELVNGHVRTEQRITMDAYNRLGLLHLWRNDLGLAESHFKSSLAIHGNPVGQTALLRIYQQTRQFEACVNTADLLLESTQNRSVSADVLSSKGDCLSQLGRPAEARQAYQQSIVLDSDKNYRAVKGLSGTQGMVMKAEHWWSSLTLITLIACAVIFGYLQSVDTANPRSLLKWSQSQWISTESASANGYFRHTIELDNAPQRAVLQVSGTDNLQIYVNGKSIKSVENRSLQATAVLDLSNHLLSGSNVLAFELHRSSFPAMVALRYELTVIDALGQRQIFISDSLAKSQSLYPQTTSRHKWFDKGYDDAFWTNSVQVAGDNRMAQVTMPPELLLALPSPPSYVLDASQHWSVALSTTFNYAAEAEEQVWLAIASDVPYEAIINGISGGIFSPTEAQLHLNSVLPRLKDGQNSLEINLMNNGVDPVVAGGLIRQNDYQVTTTFISPDWQVRGGGGSGHSALEDIRASSNLTQVRIAVPAVPPTYAYIVNDSFTPPAVAQAGPWLQGAMVVLFIVLVAPLFRLLGVSLHKQLTSTSFANAIAILCLVAAWFVAQDVRFDARQIFSISALQLMLIVWMLMVIVVLAEQAATTIKPATRQARGEINSGNQFKLGNTAYYVVGVVVAMAALLLRLHNIDQQALTVDEATIAGFARGVVERGYPYLMVGGMEVELATYELVPYFLAASVKMLGYSDFALRIPAVLFGTGTCLLIIYCGSAWFGRLAGLVAGVLYAISPWAIYWGKNCFHPSQIQFFNLLALIAFYRLLASDRISLKLACLSALAFAFSYLSWEGSGLVLPIMAFVAIVIRWQDWRWFFQPNLWIAAVLIIFVVAAQGIRRSLLQEPFIMVGFGKSDLATPKLTFTQSSYEPWYYINNFFFTETHIGLSLFFLLGLIFMFYDRKLSFVMLFVVMAYLSLTNLLGYYNAHYFYFVLPVFLLAVAAVFVKLLMLIQRQVRQVRGRVFRAQGVLTAVLIMAVLMVPAGAGGLHLYRLMSDNIDAMRVDYRPDLAGMDGRSVSLALSQYWRNSDVLITSIPLLTEHYVENRGDYFVQTITDRKVVYDTVKQRPYYVDKFVGNPVLRNKQELQDVLSRHDRVFFVAAPVDGLTRIIDAETLDFINQNMRVVAESYDSRLYLWER